jgi:[ribosomal protein S5]-alanine N-acetyltransferase
MLALDLSQFPVLRTAQLVLRELVPEDATALFALRSDERVMRLLARPRATTLQDAEQLIATIAADRSGNSGITWGITLCGSDILIGTIGFYRIKAEHHCAEVGYLLHPDHWGKGIMGEALDAVVAHGFESLGFHRIEAVTDPANTASSALLARHGFRQEAHLREDVLWDGRFLDSLVWGRLVGE